ncbi:hypothetical protein KAI87_03490, partial [Myxococcota bacterium]|nr:hypothetical protein [Myxococcota bacterium]
AGQFIKSDGTLQGTNIRFSTDNPGSYPALAVDPKSGDILLVWDGSDDSIYARPYSKDGTALHAAATMSTSGKNAYPAVAWDAIHNTFLVVWEHDSSTDKQVLGCYMTRALGTPTNAPFIISDDTAVDPQNISAASNPGTGETLVVWHDNLSTNDDIFGRYIDYSTLDATGTVTALMETSAQEAYPTIIHNSSCGIFTMSALVDGNFDLANLGECHQVHITQTSPSITTESGDTATLEVVLDSAPTDDVIINIASDNAAEGTVSPAQLTFTSTNWDTAQVVTVTGVDDADRDGHISYDVVFSLDLSSSDEFAGLYPQTFTLTNTDNDMPGVAVSAISGPVSEGSGQATFDVVLLTQPSDDVVITTTSDDGTEGAALPTTLTFTTSNWMTTQTVTVTGQDDDEVDGNITFSILLAATSTGDTDYDGMGVSDVSVVNVDDDQAGIAIGALSGPVSEAGGSATFTVILQTQPTDDVSLAISSSDTTEGSVAPATLIFTTANWMTAQTVTVTGVDDDDVDGAQTFDIVIAAATSSDTHYAGIDPTDIMVINLDDDSTAPASAPTLSWDGSATSGVAPENGLAGTDFEFTVVYTSSDNTAPATAELLVDIDGDGNYGVAMLPPVGGNYPLPPQAIFFALFALGMMLLWRSKKEFTTLRPVMATGAALLALSIALPMTLAACGGDDGECTSCPPAVEVPVAERYALVAADASDTNYADGKVYHVNVVIDGEPRTVNYKFFMSDGAAIATGAPSEVNSLTIVAE